MATAKKTTAKKAPATKKVVTAKVTAKVKSPAKVTKPVAKAPAKAAKKAPLSKTATAIVKIQAAIAKLNERKTKISADIAAQKEKIAQLKAAASTAAPAPAKKAAKPVAKKK
jgi:hypothetical protein